jgi:hypothetical protein
MDFGYQPSMLKQCDLSIQIMAVQEDAKKSRLQLQSEAVLSLMTNLHHDCRKVITRTIS